MGVVRRGRALPTALRIAAIALVLAAPLSPPIPVPGPGAAVVYVVDRSASEGEVGCRNAEAFVRQAWAERGETRVGIVTFASDASVRVRPGAGEIPEPLVDCAVTPADGSDLERALRLAAAALPDGGERRVVLITDGRATHGDARAAAAFVARDGVEVDVVPLPGHATEVVASVRAEPQRAALGEPIDVVAAIRAAPGTRRIVRFRRDGATVHAPTVEVGADGRAEVRFHDPRPEDGAHVYSVDLLDAASDDARAAHTVAMVSGRPTVLVVTTAGELPGLLERALDQAGLEHEIVSLMRGPPDADRLAEADLVVLADVPLDRPGEVSLLAGLPDSAQATLVDYVRQRGGGLLVTGGAFGFNPDYAQTAIARLLPVEIEDQGEIEDPPVAMAIMLDRSGSMGMRVGEHTKLALAVEASLAAATTLRADDRVAIASVDTSTTWHQQLAPTSELLGRRDEIRAMHPGGGGIFVYTALADAYAHLQTSRAPIRHVLIFSDTADSEEQYRGCPFMPCDTSLPSAVGLARAARVTGITTSAIGIGNPTDSDVGFLQDLAASGGGRYYLTSSGTDLRRIFVSETRAVARSNLREEATPVVATGDHAILAGVDVEAAPALGGFVQANRRPTADTVLTSRDDRPLLAAWRYGLGTVIALTTDAGGRWTDRWLQWPGGGQIVRQALRFAMRRQVATGADARLTVDGERVELTLDLPQSATVTPHAVRVTALSANGTRDDVAMELTRVAPGRYRAWGRGKGQPFAIAQVFDEAGALVAEAVGEQRAAAELSGLGADERALREIADAGGGRLDPSPADTMRPTATRGRVPAPTWPWLLALAACLLAADLWSRRLGRRRARSVVPSLAEPDAARAAHADPAPFDAAA